MRTPRFELGTSSLSATRSNQLSYVRAFFFNPSSRIPPLFASVKRSETELEQSKTAARLKNRSALGTGVRALHFMNRRRSVKPCSQKPSVFQLHRRTSQPCGDRSQPNFSEKTALRALSAGFKQTQPDPLSYRNSGPIASTLSSGPRKVSRRVKACPSQPASKTGLPSVIRLKP